MILSVPFIPWCLSRPVHLPVLSRLNCMHLKILCARPIISNAGLINLVRTTYGSHAHELISCAHHLLSRAHDLLSCAHDILSFAHKLQIFLLMSPTGLSCWSGRIEKRLSGIILEVQWKQLCLKIITRRKQSFKWSMFQWQINPNSPA